MTEQQAEQMLGVTLRPPRMEKWDYPKKEMFPTPTARDYKEQQTTEQGWEQQSQSEPSGQRNNVADTNDKGVRTRINGSDNDLQKEGRGGGDDRTTSRTDVGSNTKTTKNGEMGLSEKGDVPYTHSKGL